MPRLLVVEDERKLLRSLQRGLEAAGFEVVTASSGELAQVQLAARSFDAIVLDWMLPDTDGMHVLGEMRRTGNRTPVLLLTARDGVDDRVRGLDQGADDYLIKPFAFAELVARVRALLRRGLADRETKLGLADLHVDLLERQVMRGGEMVALRGREYEVLVYMLRHRGNAVTRDMLGRDVWKEPLHDLTNVIDVTMTQLRRKLERPGLPALIHTVRGVGYCLRS